MWRAWDRAALLNAVRVDGLSGREGLRRLHEPQPAHDEGNVREPERVAHAQEVEAREADRLTDREVAAQETPQARLSEVDSEFLEDRDVRPDHAGCARVLYERAQQLDRD